MGDSAADSLLTGESHDHIQEQEVEPVTLIPKGFVVEEAQTSIFLEDIGEDDEVWLFDIPVAVDPQKLLGQQLDFRQETSFIIDGLINERCVTMPSREPCSTICLLSSHYENSKKIVALNPSGKISVNVSYDVPTSGSMIPEGTRVPLPTGLKVRHPFLGASYKGVVKIMEFTDEKPEKSRDDVTISNNVAKDKRITVANENISPDFGPLEEVHGETLNLAAVKNEVLSPRKSKKRKLESQYDSESFDVHGETLNLAAVKNEVLSPRKSKKRKRESQYDSENYEALEHIADEPGHLSKKYKREEKLEENSFQEFPGKEVCPEAMDISVEEVVVKKRKKDKRRASDIVGSEVNTQALLEDVDPSNGLLPMQKKEIKKEKREHLGSGEWGGVSVLESPKKAKKKKRESEIMSGVGQSGVLPAEIVMVGEESGWAVKESKGTIKEFDEGQNISALGIVCKEDDSAQEMVLNESSRKKRSKKRQTVENTDIVSANLDSEAPHSSTERKIKEYAEVEMHNEGIKILHEEVNHMKKKSKKDKKRDSEVKISGLELEALKEENDIILETPEGTPKKKIKEELKYSVKAEGVADVSWAGPSILFEVGEETPKKMKKKKKRDSETGDSAGQGSVLSDSVVIDESPGQILGKDKKMRKEIKREMDRKLLEVTIEEEGGAEVKKSKKRCTMDKVALGDGCGKLKEPSLIPGGQGIDSMETIKEEVEVLMEEGDHVRKKKKKDKKRESEVRSGELDVGVLKGEVDIILDTPEHTPKRKKKKIKDEFHSGVEGVAEISLLESPVLIEEDDKSSKKIKKKKKRDSEYGDAAFLSGVSSEDAVKLEEISGQAPEVVGKLKRHKWYIDPEPSNVDVVSDVKSPTERKKSKKVSDEGVLDINLEGHNAFDSSSKKSKRRHTMDSAGAAAGNADCSSLQSPPDMKKEGKSHHKKRQSLMIPGFGAELLSPKKEKKIKKESIR